MFSLSGKIALVTGGCSGIGLAIVARFMAAGAQVIAADLTTTPAFNKTGASFVALDVTDEDRLTQVFEEVEANFGKLDILVNNAGIGLEEGPLI